VAEVVADKREVEFLGFDIHDPAKALDGFAVHQVTADAINGIGRIDDNTPLPERVHHVGDLSAFRILGMYF
jgi:hypothetical protein